MSEEQFAAVSKRVVAETDIAALVRAVRDIGPYVEAHADIANVLVKNMDMKKLATAVDKLLEQPISLKLELGFNTASPIQIARRMRTIRELLDDEKLMADAMKQSEEIKSLKALTNTFEPDAELLSLRLEELVEGIYNGPNLKGVLDDLGLEVKEMKDSTLELVNLLPSARGASRRAERMVEKVVARIVQIGDESVDVDTEPFAAAKRAAQAAKRAAKVAHNDPEAKAASIRAAEASIDISYTAMSNMEFGLSWNKLLDIEALTNLADETAKAANAAAEAAEAAVK